jgi:hypothetical protein
MASDQETIMSSFWMISPIELPSEFSIDPAYLSRQMNLKWELVKINDHLPIDNVNILEWKICMEEGILSGGLQRNQQGLSIDRGQIPDMAVFALWYRSIILAEFPLFLYISSFSKDPYELKMNTNLADLLRYLSA